jgi:hypothetical protein
MAAAFDHVQFTPESGRSLAAHTRLRWLLKGEGLLPSR